MSQFIYGGYTHDEGECWLQEEKQAVPSADGIPMYIACRWHINGMKNVPADIEDGPAYLDASMQAMAAAYGVDGGDASLSGTYLYVSSPSTIRGVRVERPPQLPESKGAAGVRWWNYAITLAWEETPQSLIANAGTVILESEEVIEQIGNGDGDWRMINTVVGMPIRMPLTERTFRTVIQSGRRVGHDFYPLPATPLWPNNLHGPSVRPSHHMHPGPEKRRETTWNYVFFFEQ